MWEGALAVFSETGEGYLSVLELVLVGQAEGVVVLAEPCQQVSDKNIATGETSQVITSRHFSSLLFTSMSILTSLALIN